MTKTSIPSFKPDIDQSDVQTMGGGFPEGMDVPLGVRIFEVLVASVVLLATMPIMFVVAFIIKRGTAGPALFRQKRVAKGGDTFTFVKFRTFYHDAKEKNPELYAYDYSNEELETLKFKITNDPRVTPQGWWLRNSTLDELPNFWNVLSGEMALVGPRPEIPEMLRYYNGDAVKKFSVRPGVTGLAQISGRGRLSFHETLKYDVEYVENRSFWLDLKIILATIKKIILRDGAF